MVAVAVAVAVASARDGRVVSASRTHQFASSLPCRFAAASHAPPEFYLIRTPYSVLSRTALFIFIVRRTCTTLLVPHSLRVAVRVIAFPSHSSCTRRAAAPSVVAFAFCPATSLEILVVCYSLLANTTRSAVPRSHRVDSFPRLWEVESVEGTSWY